MDPIQLIDEVYRLGFGQRAINSPTMMKRLCPFKPRRHDPAIALPRISSVMQFCAILILSILIWILPIAPVQAINLDPVNSSGSAITLALTNGEQQELQQLRTERELQLLIERNLVRSPEIRDRIELEVDRAFDRTTTLLNVMLVILTAIPILAALGFWLLRRSVISELVTEVRSQLETEVLAEMKKQKASVIQDIEGIKSEALAQLSNMVHEAESVVTELKEQISLANQELDELKSEATVKIQGMVSDAELVKDQTIQELTGILPPSTQDPLPPDAQPKIGRLTAFLDSLKSAIPQLTFSASDYVKQGNALFFESRYDDAIAAYEKALQLNPDLYDAWFGRASTLSILQQYDDAMTAYDKALRIKPDAYEVWLGQGAVLRKLHQPQQAIAAYDKALKLKPDDPLLWHTWGNLALELGQLNDAIAAYRKATDLKPDFQKAWLNQSIALRCVKQYDDAIASGHQALALKPDDAEAHYQQACAYAQQGNLTLALDRLEESLELNPALGDRARDDADLQKLAESDRFHTLINP